MGSRSLGLIKEYKTANWIVRVAAEPEEQQPFLAGMDRMDAARVIVDLNSGALVQFVAVAVAIHRPTGIEMGSDTLGDCIYRSIGEFYDLREVGRQNAKNARRGSGQRCGSYFRDIVRDAIREARTNAAKIGGAALRVKAA